MKTTFKAFTEDLPELAGLLVCRATSRTAPMTAVELEWHASRFGAQRVLLRGDGCVEVRFAETDCESAEVCFAACLGEVPGVNVNRHWHRVVFVPDGAVLTDGWWLCDECDGVEDWAIVAVSDGYILESGFPSREVAQEYVDAEVGVPVTLVRLAV
jgi:hypothetical protein